MINKLILPCASCMLWERVLEGKRKSGERKDGEEMALEEMRDSKDLHTISSCVEHFILKVYSFWL